MGSHNDRIPRIHPALSAIGRIDLWSYHYLYTQIGDGTYLRSSQSIQSDPWDATSGRMRTGMVVAIRDLRRCRSEFPNLKRVPAVRVCFVNLVVCFCVLTVAVNFSIYRSSKKLRRTRSSSLSTVIFAVEAPLPLRELLLVLSASASMPVSVRSGANF